MTRILINNAKKILNLVICLMGLTLVVKTITTAGGPVYSAGMVAGVAFFLFGAARLYYSRGDS